MANQGLSNKDSVVLDPFVGTGSILVSIAHFGPFCFGSDIDMRVLKGYAVGRLNKKCAYYKKHEPKKGNIFSNFEQYGLDKPEILRLDSCSTVFRSEGMFDAIICDPPYGLRAGAREVGGKANPTDLMKKFDKDNYKNNWSSVKDQMVDDTKYKTLEQNVPKKLADETPEQKEERKRKRKVLLLNFFLKELLIGAQRQIERKW
jgi:tRNA (guanine10-N2)-methyltransferase